MTPEDIGRQLKAGTNCGSCLPGDPVHRRASARHGGGMSEMIDHSNPGRSEMGQAVLKKAAAGASIVTLPAKAEVLALPAAPRKSLAQRLLPALKLVWSTRCRRPSPCC